LRMCMRPHYHMCDKDNRAAGGLRACNCILKPYVPVVDKPRHLSKWAHQQARIPAAREIACACKSIQQTGAVARARRQEVHTARASDKETR